MTNHCDNCENLCPPKGCTDWEKWFAQNWNRNIHRKVTIGLTGRQVFRYEPPDRIREMVAEMGPKAVEDLMRGSYLSREQYLQRMGLPEDNSGPDTWEDEEDARRTV